MLSSTFNGYPVHLIENVSELSVIKKLLHPNVYIGVDTETSGLSYVSDTIAGVCISCGSSYSKSNYHGFYIPVDHTGYPNNIDKDAVRKLVQYIIDEFTTTWWNRDYDNTMLSKFGVTPPCVGKTHDVQCMAHLVKGDSLPALKTFAEDYLKFNVLHYSDNNAENGSFKLTDPTVSYIYAAGDPIMTALLGRKLWSDYPYIRKIYPIDNKFAECMRRFMLSTELFLDKDKVKELLDLNAIELSKIRAEIFAFVGYTFKLDSNVEKAEALSRYVTLSVKTRGGQFKVDKEVLNAIDHPLAKMLLKYANLKKFRSTYLQKMSEFPQGFHINYQHCNVSCLTENNIVRTSSGYKSIKDVHVGDFVLSENGFFPVTDKAEFVDDVVRVVLRNGSFIEGNRKHPVLTSDGSWTKLGDLRDGMRVVVCRTTHFNYATVTLPDIRWEPRCRKRFEFSKEVDVEMAQCLGFIEGDGSLVSDGVKLCFSKFEPEVERFYVNLFSSRFNIPVPKRYEGNDNTVQYKFCSVSLSKWMKSLGVKAHGTEKGLDISKWGSLQQFAYVAALMDTDGSLNSQIKDERFNITFVSTSESIATNVARVLRFHGIDVHESITTKSRRNPLYRIRVRSYSRYGLFKELIATHMKCLHKVERLNSCKWNPDSKYSRWAGKEDTVEVTDIQSVGQQVVYDITVGEDHTFIANGIVTHNTGRLSSGGSSGNDFFVGFNIQNVPKVEMKRYLHYAPESSPIKYLVNDSPYKCLAGSTMIKTKSGYQQLSTITEGTEVETNKGTQVVRSVGQSKDKLKANEGILVRHSDEWQRNTKSSDEQGYFLDLGDDIYSVQTDLGDVQIRTLTQVKCKGGMRDCFVPPEGYVWISCDYAAQEMRALANLSKEPHLIQPLKDGQDIHKYVATKMFGHYDPMHRTVAKTINFAANYGGTGYTIAKRLGISPQQGEEFLNKYNETLKKATAWKQESIKEGRRKGLIFTYFGRPRAVWMYYQSSDKSKHAFADRTCMNSPIQGLGGDVIRIDYIKFNALYDPSSKSYDKSFAENVKHALTVHDETNWFTKPEYLQQALETVQKIMYIKMPNWEIPLETSPSVGLSWGTNFDIKGFTPEGVVIPDCDEDFSLL